MYDERRLEASIEVRSPALLEDLARAASPPLADERAEAASPVPPPADARVPGMAVFRLAGTVRESGKCGSVAIVGAGPGDPELLTLRALRFLAEADVVVHDRLIGPAILAYARHDALRLAVGKAKGRHSVAQHEINAVLSRHARAGRRVVRLKGGDPFVFGRGGEEIAYLRARGIAVEVVPGITAATGCAAAAGIPLTHREHAHAVTLVSGHAQANGAEPDWAALARLGQTIVVYMGASTAGHVARRLIEHGLDPATPAAVIENGTLPGQKVAVGTLADLGEMISARRIVAPALLVIGEVAAYAGAAAAPTHGEDDATESCHGKQAA